MAPLVHLGVISIEPERRSSAVLLDEGCPGFSCCTIVGIYVKGWGSILKRTKMWKRNLVLPDPALNPDVQKAGNFQPPAAYNPQGEPLYSLRLHIFPYITACLTKCSPS